MIQEEHLLAALLNSRAAWEELKDDSLSLSSFGAVVRRALDDYYTADPDAARVERSILRARLESHYPAPKMAASLVAYLDGIPAAVSVANVRQLARHLSAYKIGLDLADALTRAEREQSIGLAERYLELAVDTADTLSEWKSRLTVEDLFDDDTRKAKIRAYPKRLNDILHGGIRPGHACLIFGRPGCLSGETLLKVRPNAEARSAKTLRLDELYRRFHGRHRLRGNGPYYIQACDAGGKVYYNRVVDVLDSGQKEIYELTTLGGDVLRCTADHRILVSGNTYARLSTLRVGDGVTVLARGAQAARKRRPELCTKLPGTPYGQRVVAGQLYHRVPRHRLAFDAAINGMLPAAFVAAIKAGRAAEFRFAPQDMDIHHADLNPENNSPENLVLLTQAAHKALHAARGDSGNSHRARLDTIASIKPLGCAPCYDIEMAAPDHNFCAHGIFVHNSGKTLLTVNMVAGMAAAGHTILYVGNEEPLATLQHRFLSRLGNEKLWDLDSQDKQVARAAFERAEHRALQRGWDRVHLLHGSFEMRELVPYIEKVKPDVLVVDQIRHMETGGGKRGEDNLTWRLEAVCRKMRQMAHEHQLVAIGVSQAGHSANGKVVLSMNDLDSAKTGAQGAVDLIVGVGVNDEMQRQHKRMLSLCRNKLTGREEFFPVWIDEQHTRVKGQP